MGKKSGSGCSRSRTLRMTWPCSPRPQAMGYLTGAMGKQASYDMVYKILWANAAPSLELNLGNESLGQVEVGAKMDRSL